ncbi:MULTISPECIES: hypothetical protein [Pseudoalteromonas]|uniref:Uncharacterized protein n=1 Tax=Pseudoalteromonas luteoviolacea (strain 2ta16) TaxID=1353533 RepID=V4J8D1_PSEL2|nr:MULTISPECIES: hypothetical protein [Pseudoalteromonas]ESP91497.1 hypothetical protein PL2TA16_00296 [Pseudoalteromonas luteoviolacea 2ta16]KZN40148.1 hypothetical protein N483_18335 [Pseudoalteromonas luteoviolacea NCIMB 1944]MCG7551165.1 hypothetical protein [Pseudoalteromonas sp. Of7M-16]
MKSKINFCGEVITLFATTNDKNWGRGLEIGFRYNGIDCKVGFYCHPEFDNFDSCNTLSHEELFERAVSIVGSDEYSQKILEASTNGLCLLLALNGVNIT